MFKNIYERLGLKADLEEEQNKFIKRAIIVFREIEQQHKCPTGGPNKDLYKLLNEISFILGEDMKLRLVSFLEINDIFPTIGRTMLVLEVILSSLKATSIFRNDYTLLKTKIMESLDYSIIDLGISFKDDKFYRKGAEELDEKLILEPLEWLKKYPKAKELFSGALREILKKDYPDSITKAYSALESIVKTVLGNNKNLKDNTESLLKLISLPKQWGKILHNFCEYAHEFSSRHGKSETTKIKQEEANPEIAEAYIYLTGLVIRLIISNQEKN